MVAPLGAVNQHVSAFTKNSELIPTKLSMNQEIVLENASLREELYEQLVLEERAKSVVAAYIYHKQLEKHFFIEKIALLKEQIAQLTSEISNYKLDDNADIHLDINGDIKLATLEKLIEALYMHSKENEHFQKSFLETHRSFTATTEVLTQLQAAYIKCANSNIPNAAGYRLSCWSLPSNQMVTIRFLISLLDSLSKEVLMKFVNEIVHLVDPNLAVKLNNISRAPRITLSRPGSQLRLFASPAPPVIPKLLNLPIEFLDVDPLELARQLTILESNLCRAIEGKEFLGLAFSKKDRMSRSPNLVKMTSHFNNISRWMAWLLVSEPNLKKRAKILKRQIEVLQHLRELQNFNGIFQIVACMGSSPVYRLHKTFYELKSDKLKLLEDCTDLCNGDKNWKNYRHAIHNINPPCVPYVGVYQTDLTILEEVPDKLSNGLINFHKFTKIAKVIAELRQYQITPYNLEPVFVIQDFILKSSELMAKIPDKSLYALSLIAEPKPQ